MRLTDKSMTRFTEPQLDGECWLWTGPVTPDGYGLLTILDPKRCRGAHRVALALSEGVDVDEYRGKVVRHRCDNPPCINPSHLVLGTVADNVRDMYERGRDNNGRDHCLKGHELTDDNIYIHKKTGKRRCAICHRRRQSEYDERRRVQ